jgi:hypothetical protein
MMMQMDTTRILALHAVRACLPGVAGWSSRRRVLINLLLFDLTVLAGAWLVHQTEYAIEYGGRFNAVMAASPHRFYMVPGALVLAGAVLCALFCCMGSLFASTRAFRAALGSLPPAVSHRITALAAPVRLDSVLGVAAALFMAQAAFYTVQENLEYWLAGGALPGLSVLFGAQHLTVLPLHALMALASAILLTTLSGKVRAARAVARIAQTLAALLSRRVTATVLLHRPHAGLTHARRCAHGPVGLRAPPLSVWAPGRRVA